ncbi:3-keto-disaccharide hydrolase [Spirosoma endbachense]|uniref:DUF1080 domain-containing protein n=1 Tax=Spirosoma endbachense TaxID=2666025 RepID=A0A6P1W633_9BACT|nr:DUF1080 domain-containing protein [Spirosoma endbachense]QHW00375.1 DUF1080 domain-containing protein [Spirosoma endbachense]
MTRQLLLTTVYMLAGLANLATAQESPNILTDVEKQNGWKLLFDGVSPAGWKSAYTDNFPVTGWTLKDGTIGVAERGGHEHIVGGDIVTKDQFSAFDLSFEFNLAPGGNSGLKYFVTRSECEKGSIIGLEYQILDDKLHPDAKQGRDGNRTQASLYDLIKANKQTGGENPPGQWNTGRIVVYANNHVEHYLNGVKVLEYDRGSPAFRGLVANSKYKGFANFGEAPKGRIMLQDHGNAVNFRSIKIREIN